MTSSSKTPATTSRRKSTTTKTAAAKTTGTTRKTSTARKTTAAKSSTGARSKPATTRKKTTKTAAVAPVEDVTPSVLETTTGEDNTVMDAQDTGVIADQVQEQDADQDNDSAEDKGTVMQEMPIIPQQDLRKKELVDLVVERSGVKKRDAKPAIEAALAILGEAIGTGRELNLQPFGKLKVTRIKKGDGAQVINTRIRQSERNETPDEPAVDAAE